MKPFKENIAIAASFALFFVLTSCHSHQDWARIFMEKGEQYASQGKYDRALAEYEKAIRIDTKNQKAYLDMAEIYEKQGNEKGIIEMINMAEIISPQGIPAKFYAMKGDALKKDGQLINSLAAYQQASMLEPSNLEYAKQSEETRKMAMEEKRKRQNEAAASKAKI
jgi:tetratricopeptide (TPR) repeat protein